MRIYTDGTLKTARKIYSHVGKQNAVFGELKKGGDG
jgi:hypothetical protein